MSSKFSQAMSFSMLTRTLFMSCSLLSVMAGATTTASAAKPAAPTVAAPRSVPTAATSTATATATKPTSWVKVGLEYDLGYTMQAEEQADHSRSESLGHIFKPSLSLGSFTLMGDFTYQEDIKSPGDSEWQDSAIIGSLKPWELGKYVTLGTNAILGLPLSKNSREAVGQKYSMAAGVTVGLNSKNIGLPALTLNYLLRYTSMVNEFETKSNGDPVTAYQIRNRINLNYDITDKLTVLTRLQVDSNYSIQNVVRNSYYHYQTLNYQFTPMFAAYISHSLGSSLYTITEATSATYLENDLKLYDPKKSELSIGVTISI